MNQHPMTQDSMTKRVAIVANPTKHGYDDKFKAAVNEAVAEHGWAEPMWLETAVADPGTGQAKQAVADGADLVIACGGDGTVTACAEGVAGTGVALGIIPNGTGNLLARNLGVPSNPQAAIDVALTGEVRRIDAGTANGRMFVVMAGLGLDARMIMDTSEPLKKRLGWAAYAISVLRHLGDKPVRIRLTADGGPARNTLASTVIVGNVGWLRGGIPLLPDAEPDDGKLDAAVISARGWGNWITLAAKVMLRQRVCTHLRRVTFSELLIEARRAQPWEADGEPIGRTRRLVITAQPGALTLMVPALASTPDDLAPEDPAADSVAVV
ncbi:MAG TPA: diacylglycerol kinase family protein [Streptosporangiaceae bacterium]|jgi:YegS/Rv2252/BmrU family lipid kinase